MKRKRIYRYTDTLFKLAARTFNFSFELPQMAFFLT